MEKKETGKRRERDKCIY